MEEPHRAYEAIVGEPIQIHGEDGAYCQRCMEDDVRLSDGDQTEYNTPEITEKEPVCVTVWREADNHDLGASDEYKIFDVFHPYHLDPGVEIDIEEQGYHQITFSTTAVAGGPEESGVVVNEDPDVIRYSPPTSGLPQ